MTRLGDLLDSGQLYKAFGNHSFAQISHILKAIFVKVSKSIIFLVKSFLGNFYRHLAILSGHTDQDRADTSQGKPNFCQAKIPPSDKNFHFEISIRSVHDIDVNHFIFEKVINSNWP